MNQKKSKESKEEKHRVLQEAYEDAYPPEVRAAHAAFWDEWFASIMPPEWTEDQPSADIIKFPDKEKPN